LTGRLAAKRGSLGERGPSGASLGKSRRLRLAGVRRAVTSRAAAPIRRGRGQRRRRISAAGHRRSKLLNARWEFPPKGPSVQTPPFPQNEVIGVLMLHRSPDPSRHASGESRSHKKMKQRLSVSRWRHLVGGITPFCRKRFASWIRGGRWVGGHVILWAREQVRWRKA